MCQNSTLQKTYQNDVPPPMQAMSEDDDKNKTADTNTSPTVTVPFMKRLFTQILPFILMTYVSKEFSLFLPKFQSEAGAKTFIHAGYAYDEDLTYFDNTILTWGTDYALVVIMTYAAISCLRSTSLNDNVTSAPDQSKSLRIKSACLFLSYAISCLAGGYAHMTFTSMDQLNSTHFRMIWTICVGGVTAAGGFMGACGSEIYRIMNADIPSSQADARIRFRLAYVDNLLWCIYGVYMTWVCIQGEISYTRPACDIFVAGTSQFPPTVYCFVVVMSIRWQDAIPHMEGKLQPMPQIQQQQQPAGSFSTSEKALLTPSGSDNGKASTKLVMNQFIRRNFRYMHYIGFLLNAPLLPSYPAFVQYTSLPLGVVNAILHTNLTLAWGMQALSLRHFCKALNLVEGKNVVPTGLRTSGNTIEMKKQK